MKTTYKLKDFVTKEMLQEAGFQFYTYNSLGDLTLCTRDQNNNQKTYMAFEWKTEPSWHKLKLIEWDNIDYQEDITPYIQDLIDKDWVECLLDDDIRGVIKLDS